MSAEFRELAEYVEQFAKKEHITVDQALDYIMVNLFKEYKEKENEKF